MSKNHKRFLYSYSGEIIRCCHCQVFLKQSDDGNYNTAHDRKNTSFCQKCAEEIDLKQYTKRIQND
jgi:hypothetical protein